MGKGRKLLCGDGRCAFLPKKDETGVTMFKMNVLARVK